MKNYLVLFICCLNILIPNFCKAEENIKIGVVDLNALLMLHPKMADYDPIQHAFKLKPEENTKERQNQVVEDRGKLNALKKESKALSEKIQQTIRKRDEDTYNAREKYENKIRGKTDKAFLASEEMNYELELNKIEKEYIDNYSDFTTKLSINERKILSLKKFVSDSKFTSENETKEKLKEIKKEINSLVTSISKKKGLAIVINSSIDRIVQNLKEKIETSDFYDGTSYAGILAAKYEPREKEHDTNIKEMSDFFYSELKGELKRYLRNYNSIFQGYNDTVFDGKMFLGGQDITKDVLKVLIKKYNISKNISEVLLSVIDN